MSLSTASLRSDVASARWARAMRSSASGDGPSEKTFLTVAARSRSSLARSAALRVDDQRVDLGVVAHVEVVVERAEWVQRRDATRRQGSSPTSRTTPPAGEATARQRPDRGRVPARRARGRSARRCPRRRRSSSPCRPARTRCGRARGSAPRMMRSEYVMVIAPPPRAEPSRVLVHPRPHPTVDHAARVVFRRRFTSRRNFASAVLDTRPMGSSMRSPQSLPSRTSTPRWSPTRGSGGRACASRRRPPASPR